MSHPVTPAVTVLLAVMFASVAIGSRAVSLGDVAVALGGSTDGFDEAAVVKRIPRTLLALLAGAALGVSGAVMQGVTRNPLADPGILGVTTGASLAVVTAIATVGLSTATSYIWVAITGASVTAVFGLDSKVVTDPTSNKPLMLPLGRHHVMAEQGTSTG